MIVSVVREHHWTPDVINGLYLDDADHFGLEFWYNDIKKVSEELNKQTKK
jgi:hypothetical protein